MGLIVAVVILVVIVGLILWGLRGGPPKADGKGGGGDPTGYTGF